MSPRGRGRTSRRMLVYHSILLEAYNEKDEGIPVITVVIYPVHGPGGEPYLVEEYGSAELLSFQYQEMWLRIMDASAFMQAQAVPLYGLLPAMRDVSEKMLNRAIEDMIDFYRERDDLLRDELWCFTLLLNRVRSLPEVALQNVLRRIHMYDPWLKEDPLVQEFMAQSQAEGEAKGKAEGEAKGLRASIQIVLQTRFPDLVELAMQRVEQMQDPAALQKVLAAMMTEPDERCARSYLQIL